MSLVIALAAGPGTSVTPIDGATDSVTGYLFGFGPLGIGFVALAWLLFRGWRLVSPERADAIRAEGRADLIADRDRQVSEKHAAEEQREDALRVARELAPLLSQFTATQGALIPILQEIIADAAARRRQGGAGP